MSRLQGSVAVVDVARLSLLCNVLSPDVDPGDPGFGPSQAFIRMLSEGYSAQGDVEE